MSDDEWLPVPAGPKPDEPITYETWLAREKANEIVAARLALIARGVVPGPDPVHQLAEQEFIDIACGREHRITSEGFRQDEPEG
ncbi:hypothetical protein [Aureimonas sp. ME7]|uniref:hypothetical protein n=1 Tax=Aureimonas sp. ME7 TaxID=2744252 RepID=UPI0015FC880A|nr:hypothetical protein [Aureimonas sp. ME7]